MGYYVTYDGHLTVAPTKRGTAIFALNVATASDYPDLTAAMKDLFDPEEIPTPDAEGTMTLYGSAKWRYQDQALAALAPWATGRIECEGEDGALFLLLLLGGGYYDLPGRIVYDTRSLTSA